MRSARGALEAILLSAAVTLSSLALAISGCSSGASTYQTQYPSSYTVRPGDTVYGIATRFHVSTARLMAANGIGDPRALRVGQTLVLPASYLTVAPLPQRADTFPFHGVRESRQFAWPVEHGQVSSGFGMRGGTMHEGVDIAAPAGTPVTAADSGTVIFTGKLRGYGSTIIIRHDDHYTTVYGHNQVNLVHEGERVTRGQMIGQLGRSGHASGNNLHFEVRCDNVARNPLAYLPRPQPEAITFASDVAE
ncbi:MAG TPA: M23 family metallopeptidase [Candidatus Binataceae bacterium]|nr:M23 family metallopeptidase [Candidatus Binataceae bacterium]